MKYFICMVIIIYYYIKKKFPYYILHNNIPHSKNKLKVLTYNVQRLPFLIFRSSLDINKLLKKYDIICLQENFCRIIENYDTGKVNCIIPECGFFKMVNSGLCIYSKFPIEYINFIRFDNLTSFDNFSDKGFLIVKINNIVIVNTHLQATYDLKNSYMSKSFKQLNLILDTIKNYDRVLICGDLNINLDKLRIEKPYKIFYPKYPSHWSKMNSYLDNTSAIYKRNYLPFYFDGGIYKNINLSNVKNEYDDDSTDHTGVSFDISL